MSEEAVSFIIGRAVTDVAYRELLFSNPEEAIAEFDLTEEEQTHFKKLNREKFEASLGEMEERISRAGLTATSFAKFVQREMLPAQKLFWTSPFHD